MGEKLIISYDKISDFLFIEICCPYSEQDSDMIDDAGVVRFSQKTGAMESLEILFFESWLKQEGEIRLPVSAALWPANAMATAGVAYSAAPADTGISLKYVHSRDILAINRRNPYPGQRDAAITEGVAARLNPGAGEIESLYIRSFKARMERDDEIILPIKAALNPIKYHVTAD